VSSSRLRFYGSTLPVLMACSCTLSVHADSRGSTASFRRAVDSGTRVVISKIGAAAKACSGGSTKNACYAESVAAADASDTLVQRLHSVRIPTSLESATTGLAEALKDESTYQRSRANAIASADDSGFQAATAGLNSAFLKVANQAQSIVSG
jgi:hypothetical protein